MTNYCKISLKKLRGQQVREGYHNAAFKNVFGSTKVNSCLPFSRAEFFQSSRQHIQGMSISGVQQKLSLKESEQHTLIAVAEGGEYILKPSPESYPYAAENEHAAMQVSQLLGIDTARCGLVSFDGGELAYITKRFDRGDGGAKLHQEDLVQCFDLPSDDKYSLTYEEAGKRIQEVTGGKQAAVLDFVRRVMLAYMMGNDDLHLKNFSVQRLAGNTGHHYDKLTPNYDCLFCDAFKTAAEETTGMGLLALGLLLDKDGDGLFHEKSDEAVDKESDEYFSERFTYYGYYTGYDFLELGRRLSLPEKPVRSFINKLNSHQKKITDLIAHSFMPEAMKVSATATVNVRIKALQVTDESL